MLPAELHSLILESLSSDEHRRDSLFACSLASRTFLYTARKQLFHSTELTPSFKTVTALVEILESPECTIRDTIREIVFTAFHQLTRRHSVEDIVAGLRLFHRQAIHLLRGAKHIAINNTKFQDVPDYVFSALFPPSSLTSLPITSLSLSDVSFTRFFNFAHLISSLDSLETVSLHSVSWVYDGFRAARVPRAPAQVRWDLTGMSRLSSYKDLTDWMVYPGVPLNILHLEHAVLDNSGLPNSIEPSRLAAASLRSIDISFQGWDITSDVHKKEVETNLSLEAFAELRHLHFSDIHLTSGDGLANAKLLAIIMKLVSQLPNPLHSLTMAFSLTPTENSGILASTDMHWDAIGGVIRSCRLYTKVQCSFVTAMGAGDESDAAAYIRQKMVVQDQVEIILRD